MDNTKFDINTKGRDFFVGDIHGEYEAFRSQLIRVDFNYDIDRIFSVGDLIDRGPESVRSLRLLASPWFHAVRGNHEDFLLGSHSQYIWEMNGGQWANAYDEHELNELRDLVNKKMHLTMTVDTIYGTVGVVHAESADDWNDNSEEVTANINTWARTRIKCAQDMPIKNIDRMVVGHTILKEVVRLGNILYIDTGSYAKEGFISMLDVHEVFLGNYKILESTVHAGGFRQ